MTHTIIKIDNSQNWHKGRAKGIGGSDAACILGLNPYKSNVDLWKEKTRKSKPVDISEKPCVKYGKLAEEYLRELFKLDYPQYTLTHRPYDLHQNSEFNFIQGSFDGELIDQNSDKGILEIKTTEIFNPNQWAEWENKIPMNYFCQILHYFAIDKDFKFCKLKAQLKYHKPNDDEIYLTTRHYHILRNDYLQDIEILIEKEKDFWRYVQEDVEPPLLLPQI